MNPSWSPAWASAALFRLFGSIVAPASVIIAGGTSAAFCEGGCMSQASHVTCQAVAAALAERLCCGCSVSDASLAQMPDFNQRVAVLRQLDYISSEDVVELKVSRCAPCS